MANKIYQIQIALKGFTPKIWRRLLVPSDLLLADFHKIIQTSMGWGNTHFHHFIKDRTYYKSRTQLEDFWDESFDVDYKNTKISNLLKTEREKILYEYDFGDSWEHYITLEKILHIDKRVNYPVCLKGKMNCPPEDCGGAWRYSDILEILKQPDHDEYEEWAEWIGPEFDPEYFSIDDVNELLTEENCGCIEY